MILKKRAFRKKEFSIIFLLIMLSAFQNIVSQEITNNVKIAFLEKFTRFINWPDESSLADSSNIFLITIIGTDSITKEIYNFYKTRKIKGRNVKINYISNISEITECHLLFIANSEKESLEQIIDYTKERPILTISDTDGFAEKGVLINLFSLKNQLRFQINETAVKTSGLYVNFRLLNLAKIVNPVREGK